MVLIRIYQRSLPTRSYVVDCRCVPGARGLSWRVVVVTVGRLKHGRFGRVCHALDVAARGYSGDGESGRADR